MKALLSCIPLCTGPAGHLGCRWSMFCNMIYCTYIEQRLSKCRGGIVHMGSAWHSNTTRLYSLQSRLFRKTENAECDGHLLFRGAWDREQNAKIYQAIVEKALSSGACGSQTDLILFQYAEISGFEAQLNSLLCILYTVYLTKPGKTFKHATYVSFGGKNGISADIS